MALFRGAGLEALEAFGTRLFMHAVCDGVRGLYRVSQTSASRSLSSKFDRETPEAQSCLRSCGRAACTRQHNLHGPHHTCGLDKKPNVRSQETLRLRCAAVTLSFIDRI
eukprot:2616310-Pleurochrysis_carterae.AAC.1